MVVNLINDFPLLDTRNSSLIASISPVMLELILNWLTLICAIRMRSFFRTLYTQKNIFCLNSVFDVSNIFILSEREQNEDITNVGYELDYL